MSEGISAVVFTLNEEANIGACIESFAGVDEVIVADDGSTDKTQEIAESMGARVVRRHDELDTPEEQDIAAFEARFGWAPTFTTESRIPPAHGENAIKVWALAANDWLLGIDADERVTWNLPRIREEILPIADQVESEFVHAHDAEGNPERVAKIVKLFRRSMYSSGGRTHNVLIPTGRVVSVPFMRIDHWQVPRPNRHWYVRPILEYGVLKEDDQRSRFYLGREYYYHREYDKALTLLGLYLSEATWPPEIAQARLYSARCYWESEKGDEARRECLEAVLLNPEHKDALQLMSELYYEPWSHKWAHLAAVATNEGILF